MKLPDFFIGGVPKAGTTALWQYLGEHPEIYMGVEKEPFFFTNRWDRGFEWYESLYPSPGDAKLIGDGSINLIYSTKAPARLVEHTPRAKIIFLLRNPIERAFSDYWFAISKGEEPYTRFGFSELIRAKDEPFHKVFMGFGHYASGLERYAETLSPEQVKVVIYDDFQARTEAVVLELFEYLEVPAAPVRIEKQHNVTQHPRFPRLYQQLSKLKAPARKLLSTQAYGLTEPLRRAISSRMLSADREHRPVMTPEDREYLLRYYDQEISRIEDYTGRDLSHWRK
jgi:hypothetical protein